MEDGDVIIQNCQMGRGRTTTGMVSACLIATISSYDVSKGLGEEPKTDAGSPLLEDMMFGDGSEEEAYLQGQALHVRYILALGKLMVVRTTGEYKTILQLVGILSHGKVAKRLTDMAIDAMEGVQNLRKAIFEWVFSG